MKLTNAILLASTMAAAPALLAADGGQNKQREWDEMRRNAVSANELLSGDIRNNFNHVGNVEHLILDKNSKKVEYVLFESSYPSSVYVANPGFVNYDSVNVSYSMSDSAVLVIKDAEVGQPPEKLKLTKKQVDDRMIERLIDEDLRFADGQSREIEDILINPKSGMVSHYVVETKEDAIFDEELRTVRASKVKISEQGALSTTMKLGDLDKSQDYDPDFL